MRALRNLPYVHTIFLYKLKKVLFIVNSNNLLICNDIDLIRIIYQSSDIIIALNQVVAPMISYVVC